MIGNKTVRFILQQRDQRLLGELGVLRVIDREQAKLAAGFTSTTRANARLLTLSRAGLLRRFFIGTIVGGRKAVYSLSPKGAALVDAPFRGIRRNPSATLSADAFIEHQLRINEIHLALKHAAPSDVRFKRWLGFHEPLAKGASIIPDGYVEVETDRETQSAFVEVDRGTTPLKSWRAKTAAYLRYAIRGEFAKAFGQRHFRVLVVATSTRRLLSIRSAVAKLTPKIFWLTDFESVERTGFFPAVWLRPHGEQRVPPF